LEENEQDTGSFLGLVEIGGDGSDIINGSSMSSIRKHGFILLVLLFIEHQ
jgi:hypothetical protein